MDTESLSEQNAKVAPVWTTKTRVNIRIYSKMEILKWKRYEPFGLH